MVKTVEFGQLKDYNNKLMGEHLKMTCFVFDDLSRSNDVYLRGLLAVITGKGAVCVQRWDSSASHIYICVGGLPCALLHNYLGLG